MRNLSLTQIYETCGLPSASPVHLPSPDYTDLVMNSFPVSGSNEKTPQKGQVSNRLTLLSNLSVFIFFCPAAASPCDAIQSTACE